MPTKISELPTGQKTGNILDETLNVGGGATTATTATVTVPRTSATTNTVEPLIALNRQSSGTPANGIGASLVFDVETAAGNTERGATIEAVATDVTSTSEDFALVAKTMVAGSTTLVEGGRWEGAQYLAPSGAIGAPSYSFTGDTNTGMYRIGADNLGLVVSGFSAMAFSTTTASMGVNLSGVGAIFQHYRDLVSPRTGDGTLASSTGSASVNTNTGAAGEVILTLPAAASLGQKYRLRVTAAQYLRIKAVGSDTIRNGASVSAAAGYIRSNTIGNVLEIQSVSASEWFVTSIIGTWTIDS